MREELAEFFVMLVISAVLILLLFAALYVALPTVFEGWLLLVEEAGRAWRGER